MAGRRHLDYAPEYPFSWPQEARQALFTRDRQLRRSAADLGQAVSALEFIADVVDGKIGGLDQPWQFTTITETLTPKLRALVAKHRNMFRHPERHPAAFADRSDLAGFLVRLGIPAAMAEQLAQFGDRESWTVDLNNYREGPSDVWVLTAAGGWWIAVPNQTLRED